ncbi:MAG: LysM peptidoglycan-binding domain-containing protein [Chloroflexota bacterium]|nr:LysM peptidoglycan-binding domain-containing protein [Chloroflexota bacterium]
MTRQQAIFIIALNAIISLVISLLVVWLVSPRSVPSASPSPTPPSSIQRPGAKESVPSPQAPTPGQSLPPTPTPIVHVVKEGETLSWIARKFDVSPERIVEENNLTDPDMLVAGRELVIPAPQTEPPTEAPPPTATLPATPTEEGYDLEITRIVAPGRREAEVLVLANRGRKVRLKGWILSNGRGEEYTFPNVTLFRGTITRPNKIRIYTREGKDTPSDLYWGLDSAAWGTEVEAATLKDPQGKVQANYELH